MSCWQCGREVERAALFCAECDHLQPPNPSITHFERLGIEATFAQDEDAIVRSHRALQRKVHPDRFVSRTDLERRLSLEHATAMNDAVRTLRDPQRRATYMLRLRGMDIEAETGAIKLDPMFLMEVMELREAIGELGGADSQTERARIEHQVVSRYEETVAAVGEALDSDAEIALETVGHRAAELKYLRRILDELQAESE